MQLRQVDNPPNPYVSHEVEWLEPPPVARLQVFEDRSRSILSRNDSPDLPFTWSVNPYRGCQHACSYCYARPTHEYLGFGAGTDFDTKLVVKPDAPELLRERFQSPRWKRESVFFSGVTDCYQPLEAAYRVTRRCLEVCVEHENPAAVLTKGFLVVRDADLLVQLHERAGAQVTISIAFADAETCKLFEPQAPSPARRFEAIRRLREAGIPVGVFVSPLIPGLNDKDIPKILEKSAEAGASFAGYTALRLPGSVADVYISRLRQTMPLRADRILHRLRDVRGGKISDSRFGDRMRGTGPYWETIRDLFRISQKRLGLDNPAGLKCKGDSAVPPDSRSPMRRDPAQLMLDFGKMG
jgi:DNA repair photolyase